MAHRPIGLSTSLSTSTASGMTTSFVVQSNSLRIVSLGQDHHVKVDTGSPTATTFDYVIPSGGTATLAMTKASNRVVGMTTGTSTTVIFPEGTQCPFAINDFITITGGDTSSLNLVHVKVTSVDTSSSYDGNFQKQCTVDFDSSAITDAFAGADVTASRSVRLASRSASGTGTIHAQQVQISGQA